MQHSNRRTAGTHRSRLVIGASLTLSGALLTTGALAVPAAAAPAAPAVPAASATAVVGDPTGLGIAEVQQLLTAGTTTSVGLVAAYLARIDAYDLEQGDVPGLHSIISRNPDAAAQAAVLDAERAAGSVRGPLHGVPIIVKDNYDVAGLATTNGSIAFADYLPMNDATTVARLQAAGAIIIAKANLSEFAWSGDDAVSSIAGEVRNPYDRTRTSSGSSGGTAAAIAASFAAGGLGTDTYGSIRTPSAHQSLVGVRPTHGLVSLAGVTAQVEPQDTAGPMTMTVTDAALLLDVIAGVDEADHWTTGTAGMVPDSYLTALTDSALDGRTVAYITNADFHAGGAYYDAFSAERSEVDAITRSAVAALEAQGATVVELELTDEQRAALTGQYWEGPAYWMDEYFARNEASWPAGLAELTEPADALTVSDYLADGRAIPSIQNDAEWFLSTGALSDEDIAAGAARQASALEAWSSLFTELGIDAVVYPTDAMPAATVPTSESYSNARNAGLASGLGAPAVTVPAGYTAAGLPVGLEFAGQPFSEATLLSFAYDFEQAASVRVAPSSTPALAADGSVPVVPAVDPTAPRLAETGAPAGLPVALGVMLLLGGSALLVVRRRGQRG